MRKITIALFIILTVGIMNGQSTWTKYNKIEGRNTQQVKGDSSAVAVFEMNPVQTNGTQTTMLTGSPNSYSVWFSTAGTVKDSVVYGFTTRSVTFINDGISTDTLFVSPTSTFPSTNTIKRLGGEGFTKQWAVTKLYFKVATTPVASKKIRIEAQ